MRDATRSTERWWRSSDTIYTVRGSEPVNLSPIPEFLNHFQTLCDLLRAYGVAAQKPSVWAADIISEWTEMLHAWSPPRRQGRKRVGIDGRIDAYEAEVCPVDACDPGPGSERSGH